MIAARPNITTVEIVCAPMGFSGMANATASWLGSVATAIGLWLKGREKPIARYLGLLYYVVGALVIVALAASQLGGYLSRGETIRSIESLSGRIPLWEFAIGQLDSIRETFGRWLDVVFSHRPVRPRLGRIRI
jgi:hypothetical protein